MTEATYLSPAETAAITGYSLSTLANLRSAGEGPRWVKPKGRVRYPRADLIAWMERA